MFKSCSTATETSSRRGAAVVLIVMLLVLFLVSIAFSVDMARVQLAQIELQSTADLSARAGAEAIARGVGNISDTAATDAAVRAEVKMVAELNRAGGGPISLATATDVAFGNGTVSGSTYSFTQTPDGKFDGYTDAVTVKPQLTNFPLIFGNFVDTTEMALSRNAAAVVEERDIVLVLDRSTSMLEHDAGSVSTSGYPANLLSLRDDMFSSGDHYYPGNTFATATSHTEFAYYGSQIQLSRSQALQLAVHRFRQEIDSSRGHEKLGLVTYAEYADSPAEASSAPGVVNIDAGLSMTVKNAMVGDGTTKTLTASPHRHPSERYASALEDARTTTISTSIV